MGAGDNVFVTSDFSIPNSVGPNGEPGVIEAYAGRRAESGESISYGGLCLSYHQSNTSNSVYRPRSFTDHWAVPSTGTLSGGDFTAINTYLDAANKLLETFNLLPETEVEGANP